MRRIDLLDQVVDPLLGEARHLGDLAAEFGADLVPDGAEPLLSRYRGLRVGAAQKRR